jgi:serine/threonine protein kinase
MRLVPGARFDRYEIRSRLGAGGMGEVYLAKDLRLGRLVALKLLLPQFSASREHTRRFEQEARAASALNHPNILTIYEIGCFDSINFIAAEYIDGVTLRRRLAAGALSINDSIRIASEVASGLSAAHGAGILHRDVKPENIMLRKDGYVKLLDFGLAKLTEDLGLFSGGRDDSTISQAFTNSGTILGTVSYMSPEQLRGMTVDETTDIWSLGCVLYEMLNGRTAFTGASPADLIVSILERDYPPLNDRFTTSAPELELIISKTLAKNKRNRYQSSNELLSDLQDLRTKSRGAHWTTPFSGDDVKVRSDEMAVRPTARQAETTTRLSRKKLGTLVLLMALLLTAIGAFLISRRRPGSGGQIPDFRAHLRAKLVDTGNAVDAAISPDGKYVAYVTEESTGQSLWGRQAGTVSNAWPIVRQSALRFSGLTFSVDGNHIFYIVFDPELNQYVLYRIPALGGVSEKLLEDIDTPVTFSPDGRQFAFVRGYPAQNQTAIVLADANGKGERILAARRSPDDFGWRGGPSWSKDGELIACAVGRYDTAMSLTAVRVKDGTEIKLSSRMWPWIGRVSWVDNGTGLLLVAKELQSSPPQIWYVSYPSGDAKKVSSDLSSYSVKGVSVTADSSSFVAVQNNYLSSIWVMPRYASDSAKRLTTTKSDGYYGLAWTPDGKIVFASSASGSQDLWIMDADGNNRKQLTSGGAANYQPAVTPDGRYVVFASTRGGGEDLWRLNLSNGELTQLTSGAAADWPHCSPDSRWVVYKSYASGKKTIWKVSIDGGQPIQITDKYSDWPAVSPDGQHIACEYWDELPTTQAVLAIMSVSGRTPIKTFSFPPVTATSLNLPTNVLRWTRDGRSLTYIDGQTGVSNIIEQPISGGIPKRLSRFGSDLIFWFDFAPDGKSIACARGVVTSDVVMFGREDQSKPGLSR